MDISSFEKKIQKGADREVSKSNDSDFLIKKLDEVSLSRDTLLEEKKKLEEDLAKEKDISKHRNSAICWIKVYLFLLNIISLILFLVSFCPSFPQYVEYINASPYLRLVLVTAPASATVIVTVFIIKGIFSDRQTKITPTKINTVWGSGEI